MAIHQSTRIQAYQLRAGGSRARMAILRMIAADSANNFNPHTRLQLGDWRGARTSRMNNYEGSFGMLSQGMQDNEPVWYCHTGEQFRNERDAHEVCRSLDRGWFTDIDGDETAIGIVASLPHGRFIAGYRWTSNDERVYFGRVFNDETDAARMADEHARVFAENARDDAERFDAMQDAEGLCESKESDLREAWEDYRAIWSAFLADRVTHAKAAIRARESLSDLVSDLRAARRDLADATAAYERG